VNLHDITESYITNLLICCEFAVILQKAKKNEIGDAVILDVDTNTLSSEYDDFEDLPSDIVSILN